MDIGALIAIGWVRVFGDEGNPNYAAFLGTLVHEIEHAMGRDHVYDANGNVLSETPNSRECSA